MKRARHKKYTEKELMKLLDVDVATLRRFKQIQNETIAEAKLMRGRRNKKIKILGVSGSARGKLDMAQEESNSEELLMICLAHCERLGAEPELIKLRDYRIEHCRACYSTTNTQCHFYCTCYPKGEPQGDDMTNILYDKVLEADAIIFATPVNNFNMSTLTKAFVDRCISLDGSLKPANPQVPKDKGLNIKHMKFIELTADNSVPGSGMLRRFLGKVAGIIATGHEEGASVAISSLFMTLNHYGMVFPPFSNMYAMSSICDPTYKDKKIVLTECYREEAVFLAENVMAATESLRDVACTKWKYDYSAN
ncbi:MAG: NAD(P)H-dependent oxidoreductase [candidate division WOR-3 bacterium]|nr:MAG: NAD(P)H-dependent oxidoreductase [candidate division WOR-3 bacterium]